MKKKLFISPIILLALIGCTAKNGVSITFTAKLVGKTPNEEVKSFSKKGVDFSYLNVYNDGNGNFMIKNNTGYLATSEPDFGLRVKTKWVYQNDGTGLSLVPYQHINEEGYYEFAISPNTYTEIRGYDIEGLTTTSEEYINVGTITMWC